MFDAKNAIDLIGNQLVQRDFYRAIETSEQAISQYPESGALYELAGLAWIGAGKLEKGVSRLESATVMKPLGTVAQLRLASAYWRLGHQQTAIAVIDFLVERFQACKFGRSANAMLVLCLAEMKLFSEAADICVEIFRRDSTDGDACFGVAWYRSLGGDDIRGEILWLERAVRLAPDNVRYKITLGCAYADSSDIQSAVNTFLGIKSSQTRRIQCKCCLSEIIEFLSLHGYPKSSTVLDMRKQLNLLSSKTDKGEN